MGITTLGVGGLVYRCGGSAGIFHRITGFPVSPRTGLWPVGHLKLAGRVDRPRGRVNHPVPRSCARAATKA